MSKHYPVSRLQQALQQKEGLNMHRAALVALRATVNASEQLLDALDLWIDGKLPEKYAIGEYTLAEMKEVFGAGHFEALMLMDAFARYPEKTEELTWLYTYDDVRVEIGEEM